MMKEVGNRLKKAREQSGLTQNQVAKILGIAREQVSYYENGKREIGVDDLLKFADIYGVTPSYFLNPEAEKPVAVSFRTSQLSDEDLPVIIEAQRFLKNLYELEMLLEKAGA